MNDFVNKYIGLTWAANGRGPGFDCWGLVMQIYKEQLGITLPDWQISPFTDKNAIKEINRHTTDGSVEEIETPEDFDIAMAVRRKSAWHVGMCIGGGIIHVHAGQHGSTFETHDQFKMYSGNVRYYRWLR